MERGRKEWRESKGWGGGGTDGLLRERGMCEGGQREMEERGKIKQKQIPHLRVLTH